MFIILSSGNYNNVEANTTDPGVKHLVVSGDLHSHHVFRIDRNRPPFTCPGKVPRRIATVASSGGPVSSPS